MDKLQHVLAQEDTVLFIGSGISMWCGLPSWSRMIEELAIFIESTGGNAELIRSEAKKGDLLQAASYGFDKLTKQQINEFILNACQYGKAQPHDIHKKIVSLGPKCFVTTNYDNLIEESLRKWQSNLFFRPPVTNRHLTETAEIIHARSSNFIFKPHGDAADGESIILTREQYRKLLPGGERHAALESLKMLMASRPVVYLGFGLRDPDFLYLKDLLANTYKGGSRDHFAIMADITESESDFWRRNYGIHFISYKTKDKPNKRKDHSELLRLLDSLVKGKSSHTSKLDFAPLDPTAILALTRHASALARSPQITPEFTIRVHSEQRKLNSSFFYRNNLDHSIVDKFLDKSTQSTILTGLPGAGKSYSLRRASARAAEKLYEACLSESFSNETIVVPILADLKMYRGDLVKLVSNTLPKSLPFTDVIRAYNLKIFLDSFNEMPREYLESGEYEADFLNFISKIGNTPMIIASRTNDGLKKLELPTFCLDQIDEAEVKSEIQKLGIEIEGRFSREIMQLLQRPFYFQYVLNQTIKLPNGSHPRDFYQLFFENLQSKFSSNFKIQVNLKEILSITAYNALNNGEEAFLLSALLAELKNRLELLNTNKTDVRDIANWLVSHSILIPYTGGRVAFLHQSITEFLAASELANRYSLNPYILKEKLSFLRWDQAIFLTLSLLPSDKSEMFFKDIISTDIVLALNAVKYLEIGREEVVSKLLSEICKRSPINRRLEDGIEHALSSSVPITDQHEPYLRKLLLYKGLLGGAAAKRLIELKGVGIKDEMMNLLVECADDYNFCVNSIARSLKPFITESDIESITKMVHVIEESSCSESIFDKNSGFIYGVSSLLSELELSTVCSAFIPRDESKEVPKVCAEIICDVIKDHNTTHALNIAAGLLLRGVKRAAVSIYFITKFSKPDVTFSWASFSIPHVDLLISLIYNENSEDWGCEALTCLCSARADLEEYVKKQAEDKSGINKVILLHCISPNDFEPIFQLMADFIEMDEKAFLEQPIHLLNRIRFDWSGREELFVKLLKLRNIKLTQVLFGGSWPPSCISLGMIDIGPVNWWLEWLMEEHMGKMAWLQIQFGGLFANHLTKEDQKKFILEFNNESSKYRPLLTRRLLGSRFDVTTDDFNDDAISYLLADLNKEDCISPLNGHILGWAATEKFVEERLLPLVQNTTQPFSKNLNAVIKQAGSRHGRRFTIE